MNSRPAPVGGLTWLGKLFSLLLILGLIGGGAYFFLRPDPPPPPPPPPPPNPNRAPPAIVCETRFEVPELDPPATAALKDGVGVVELSEYAGYAGLIAANGGLEPSENSFFFKRHGVKVKLTLSEEESWSALNSGRIAASATTVDVLAVYGKQFHVVVPAQIGFSRGADGVIVSGEIRRINALKGKLLTAGQFTESDFFIRYLAQEAGLSIGMVADVTSKTDPERLNLCYCNDAFTSGDLFLSELQAGRTRLAGCVTWDPKTTEVVQGSGGKARLLATNRNLLIVADVLIVNRGLAQQNPKFVQALVHGLLEGNRMVRESPDAHLQTVGKAFGWDAAKTRAELAKVHLSNLPESLAFFAGTIDAAGSYGRIYNSAVLAYGTELIKDPVDGDRFLDLQHLKGLEQSGEYKDQKMAIAPIRAAGGGPVENNPLLSKEIRFLFAPNSADLDVKSLENLKNLEAVRELLRVSPGSTLILRGHVDDALVEVYRKEGGEKKVREMALQAIDLSRRRAMEIRRLLIEKHGVDGSRVEFVGRGWLEPLGSDPEMNRRVEVQWFTLE
jgi:NitT/TauT family transport system substrate-binding protein